jgi:hypothetical protein
MWWKKGAMHSRKQLAGEQPGSLAPAQPALCYRRPATAVAALTAARRPESSRCGDATKAKWPIEPNEVVPCTRR